ncbi:unnamed protein product [Closterium sp. NIES-54]
MDETMTAVPNDMGNTLAQLMRQLKTLTLENCQVQAEMQQLREFASIPLGHAAPSPAPKTSNGVEALPERRSALKLQKPEPFDPSQRDANVRTWIFMLNNYFAASGVQDADAQQRIEYSVTVLRSPALEWWRQLTQSAVRRANLDGHQPGKEHAAATSSLGVLALGVTTVPTTWEGFEAALKSRFDLVNASEAAGKRLRNFRQIGKLQEYTRRFLSICNEIDDITEAEMRDCYLEGLKPDIVEIIAIHGLSIFESVVAAAERIDAVRSRRDCDDRDRGYNRPINDTRSRDGPSPMEIGAVNIDSGSLAGVDASKPATSTNVEETALEQSSTPIEVDTVDRPVVLLGKFRGVPVKILVDSGASHSFVSLSLVTHLHLEADSAVNFKDTRMVDGTPLHIGPIICKLCVVLGPITVRRDFDSAMLDDYDFIFGRDWLRAVSTQFDWAQGSCSVKVDGEFWELPQWSDGATSSTSIINVVRVRQLVKRAAQIFAIFLEEVEGEEGKGGSAAVGEKAALPGEDKTTFRTKQGLFEFRVLPFDLTNAPFHMLMNTVLFEFLGSFVVVYLGDILIFSKTKEEHVQHLQKVFEVLRKEQLYAMQSKCEFFLSEVEFLGHAVSGSGIRTDPKKIAASQLQLSRRHARWMEFMEGSFHYRIEYKPGVRNPADPLTRPSCQLASLTVTAGHPLPTSLFEHGYTVDPDFTPQPPTGVEVQGSVYIRKGTARIWVPAYHPLRQLLLSEAHNVVIAGHFGADTTAKTLSRTYFWPGLTTDVEDYIRSCDTCQLTKSSRQRKAGISQPIPPPDRPWQVVTMDFIMALPRTVRGHDAIFVVVDTFSQAVHFIPTHGKVTSEEAATLFVDNVVRLHGVLDSIISDHDPRFTSKFWKQLFTLFGTRLAMSSAYHLETDGQTECVNQNLEQILRNITMHDATAWDKKLSMAEFAYNNTHHSSTGMSPFFALYGQHPNVPTRGDLTPTVRKLG